MKKSLAVLLSVVMLLSLIPLVSLAAWTKEPVITLTASEPDENGSVAVTIQISESDLITGYGLGLEYDSSIYEVDENAGTYETGGRNSKKIGLTLESDDEYFAATNSFQYNHNRLSAADGEVKIFFITDGNNDGLTEKGMEATFFFKVKSGAMPAEVGHSQTAVFKITSQRAGDTLLFKVMSENDDLAPVPTENNEVTVVLPLIVHVDPVMSPIDAQTYTGSAIKPTVELKDGETVVPASEYTLSYASNVHAGTATVTATPKTGSAYIFQNGPVSGQFTINPLTATFDWGTTTLTYSGAEQSVTATVSNLCGSDTANLTYTGNTATDVGSYTAEVTAIDNGDYALPADGSASQAWSITKADYSGAALSASAIVPAKGIADKSFQLSELNLPASFQNAKITAATPDGSLATAATVAANGKSITYTTAEAADNAAGSVTLTISSKNWNNVTATLNLTARTLDTDPGFAGVSVADVEYGQTNAEAVSLPRTVTLTDPENNSIQAALSVKDADKVNNAGTATVTVVLTVTQEGVYKDITAEKNFDYTVSPKAVAVTWDDTALTYTGAAQAPTASAEGVNGETLSLGVSGAQTDAGENYTATASIASVTGGNANPANYTLTADTATFSIAPKATTFTITLDKTVLTENGAEQKPAVTVRDGETVLTEGTDYSLAFAPAESILPGSYTVTATGAGNYAGSSGSASYTIQGKPGYKSLSLVSGGTALTANYSFDANCSDITGYSVAVSEVEGETVTPVAGSPFDAGTATSYTVGNLKIGSTYRVVVTATNAVGSTASEPKDIDLTLDTEPGFDGVTVSDVEYGKTNAEAASFAKDVSLTDPEGKTIAAELSVKDPDKVNNAGSATLTMVLTITEAGTYNGITVEKDFTYTVAPKETAVTWADTALTYTGAAQAPTASAEGVNGETLSLGVSGAQTDAGENYTATASIASVTGGNANPANYTLAADTATFSIAPKATTFTVTLDKTVLTENGAEQKPGVTVQDGETVLTEGTDYSLAFAPAESILPGSYTVTATGVGNYAGSSGTAGYSIIGKPGYVSLSLSNGQTALTASYSFQDNGADITGYSVAVAEVDGETVTAIEGSPFDAGTETRYTVENLETGKTYRVTVTATNAVGSTDSEAQEITLSRRSSVPMYPVTVEQSENGSVSANYSFCKAGNTVKLTVNPDEGYVLAELTVTDADGKAVEVAEDNSFVMPAAAVTVSAVFQAEGTEPLHFDDVAEDAWYHDSVYWAAGEGVAQGKDEHIFASEDISSRGELITFLWRAAGKPESTIANPYTDVSESDECYQAVLWATEQGITVGTAEGEFSPHAAVTRAQMVVFIYRAEQAEPVDVENPFTDVEADAYCYDAVLWAVDKGVTVGTSATTFSPNMSCTRAHAVTFLYRLYA